MEKYEAGQIWVDNNNPLEKYVLWSVGGVDFEPNKKTNHLLVRIGNKGKILKAKGNNVLVVSFERLTGPRYSLQGTYPTLKQDFSFM